MKTITALSESERATLTNSLRVAAERFDENAKQCRAAYLEKHDGEGIFRLAQQFDRQASESRELADRIDNAESITIASADEDAMYHVIDLDTDESHGHYDTLIEARSAARYDRLRSYVVYHEGVRVEHCDLCYDDDGRAKQGLELSSASGRA